MNNEARKISQAIKEFKAEIESMVTVMGVDATEHYKQSFVDEGFTDSGIEKWKPRKREDRKRPGRAILTDTGRLRRSIRWRKFGKLGVRIQSNVPYALRHNEGLSGMPKRQFVGYSAKLNNKLVSKFNSRIKAIFK